MDTGKDFHWNELGEFSPNYGEIDDKKEEPRRELAWLFWEES